MESLIVPVLHSSAPGDSIRNFATFDDGDPVTLVVRELWISHWNSSAGVAKH